MEKIAKKNTKLLLIINTIGRIIDIFLGPFLTSYLFKVSVENIQTISTYNIFSYLIIALVAFFIGRLIKNSHELPIFILGMIFKFIQLVIITLLGDNVVNYIWLLAIISGFAIEMWAFPLNVFSSKLVMTEDKKSFVVYKNMLTSLVKILVPFLLGTLISAKSFITTAPIILIFSFIQIILATQLKNVNRESKLKLDIMKEIKKIKKSKKLKSFYKMKFFRGMAYKGALETTIVLLIIIAFDSDFSLGIVTSITSFLAIISAYIYRKIKKESIIKKLLIFSCGIILTSAIILICFTNQYTIICYNLIYAFFLQFIIVSQEVETLKFTNSEVINDENRVETYVLLECVLNAGRIISYVLLLIVGIFNKLILLELLIIILILAIFIETKNFFRFCKED